MSELPHLDATPQTEAQWFQALIDLARYLRTPAGCPWDREHGAQDFTRFLQDEARELSEAFASSGNDHIAEEFGDTLFTLLAAAAAAEEEGRFTLGAALAAAHEKMVRRHDHVFGEHKAATPEEALAAWERVKAAEKARKA